VRGVTAGPPASALADHGALQVELIDNELRALFDLARRHELTGYDAACGLAGQMRAPLAIFDRCLAEAAIRHLGSLG